MGQQLLRLCLVEARRLIWLAGMMFAVIFAFYYFEFPFGYVLPSSFSAGKVSLVPNSHSHSGDSPSKSEVFGNMTISISSNSPSTFSTHERANWTSKGRDRNPENASVSDRNESSPMNSLPNATSSPVVNKNISTPIVNSNLSTLESERTKTFDINENSRKSQKHLTPLGNNSSSNRVPKLNKGLEMPDSSAVSISQMNGLLLQNRASYKSMAPGWSEVVDRELLNAKSLIEKAPIIKNNPNIYAPLYRNFSMFIRSYELMEETLKVYVYREGEKPVLHQPRLNGIYASEGWFMKLLEANKKFLTRNPRKAHLFYLPFSSLMLEETLYIANSHSFDNLKQYLKNYLNLITAKYPFWNRTGGADHFLVACHDWAPTETNQLMANCIRALCNADVKGGFVLGKDVSLPETLVRSFRSPLRDLGGKPPSQRSILAFFAGSMHGYVRPILLQHWENKDPNMKIFGRMPKSKGNKNYIRHMKNSKYCICAKGYEVNSPRVVEAIFYECVPVIISDNFVPPFFEVLNWESFAVFILEKDIPNLKSILLSIPEKRYLEMQMGVKKVQKHFLWHAKPEKYDIFHLILHSIWYNRLHQISPR
ncbi:hypothetical protein I3843_Q045700 [Carya illinoinensis]|nr:hypothetical protein I3843_Q045700 [Carya illinoinensis]KAG6670691.1 hypothetical protein I3843_Q045700 [Carya illinoinensis]